MTYLRWNRTDSGVAAVVLLVGGGLLRLGWQVSR